MKTLILHGLGGSDFPHWQSWLAGELAKDYGTVCLPLLEDKDAPQKDVWARQVIEILDDFKPDTVVCHSLANTLWFHLCLDQELKRINKLFLVAPPSFKTDIKEISTFFPLDIPNDIYAKKAVLVTSTNDPYMDQGEATKLAESLNIEHIILKDAGHINTSSGFGEWIDILEMVKN